MVNNTHDGASDRDRTDELIINWFLFGVVWCMGQIARKQDDTHEMLSYRFIDALCFCLICLVCCAAPDRNDLVVSVSVLFVLLALSSVLFTILNATWLQDQ